MCIINFLRVHNNGMFLADNILINKMCRNHYQKESRYGKM